MKKTMIAVATLASMTMGLGNTALADTTQQFVETNHGWVSYHSNASLSSPIIGKLLLNQQALLIKKVNAYWYEIQVNNQEVYITTNSNYTHVVTVTTQTNPTPTQPVTQPTNSGTSTTTTQPTINPAPSTEPEWQIQADKLITTAKTQLGAPYYWGHQVPIGSVPVGQRYGFDCSNFVAWTYNTALGIKFSGSSTWQRYNEGTPVALSDIREGDILFFTVGSNTTGSGHVGIYEGNGMIIQEGGGYGKVTEEPLQGTWFGRNLVFARRVIN